MVTPGLLLHDFGPGRFSFHILNDHLSAFDILAREHLPRNGMAHGSSFAHGKEPHPRFHPIRSSQVDHGPLAADHYYIPFERKIFLYRIRQRVHHLFDTIQADPPDSLGVEDRTIFHADQTGIHLIGIPDLDDRPGDDDFYAQQFPHFGRPSPD